MGYYFQRTEVFGAFSADKNSAQNTVVGAVWEVCPLSSFPRTTENALDLYYKDKQQQK